MASPETPSKTDVPAWLLTALAAVLGGCHAWFLYSGFSVDAVFVDYRYASRIQEGLGLTWTTEPPIERYTSLIWVQLLAAWGSLGVEHIRAARWMNYAFGALAIASVCLDPARMRPSLGRAATGGLLLAVSGSLAAWTMGGSEHVAMAAAVGVAILASVRAAETGETSAKVIAALAGVCLVGLRTDAYPLALGLLVGGAAGTRSVRPWLPVAVPVLGALAADVAFRVSTYGTPVPATIPPELGPFTAALGLKWLASAAVAHIALILAAVSGPAMTGASVRRSIPLAMASLGALHLLLVGGDAEPGWRGAVPLLPAMAFLASEGLGRLIDDQRARGIQLAAAAALAHGVILFFTGGLPDARDARSTWYRPPMTEVLRGAFGEASPLLAVEEPGIFPYWTGLETIALSEHAEVEDRPDILVLRDRASQTPSTRAARTLMQSPDFTEYYQRVGFTTRSKLVGRQRFLFWIRREGGALGIERTADEVRIPGFFLASPGSWAARWNGEILAAPLTEDRVSVVPHLLLRAGNWEVSVPQGEVAVDARCKGSSATRVAGRSSAVLQLDEPGHVDLVLWASEEPVPVTEVVLRKTDELAGRICDVDPEIPWSELLREVPEGADRDYPGAVPFGKKGIRVRLDGPVLGQTLGIALDGNDRYQIRWFREGTPLGRTMVPPSGEGLTERFVTVPRSARVGGADRFVVVPTSGDGWSLGAARFSAGR